jgi:RHS repeat-associated protein
MLIANCRQFSEVPSAFQRWSRSRRFLGCLFLICFAGVVHAVAQINCPAPWASAQNVYGFVSLEGHGSGSSGSTHETANQSAVTAGKLAGLVQGSCAWQAIPQVGFGQMKSLGNVNDVVTDPNNPSNNATWSAFGTGDILWDSMTLQIIPSAGQYVVGAFGAIPGTLKTDQGTINEDIIWGATSTNGGVSEPNQPFPPTPTPLLFGSANYQATPLDNAQGGEIANVNWTATWLFTPVPDGNCDDCKHGEKHGSEISVRSQSLAEDIPIVGTEFVLHYESERAVGRAGADLFAIRDALSLGGWTLDVHHAFEPLLMVYCAGGSCTPYAVVPKALFLGDGSTRNSSEVQAPLVVGSTFQLTSEDGSEIYVFDAATAKHTQTLLPMTGAVLYNFAYDANGLLISVTDGSGNVTTIQRDGNGHPTAIVSPYGQTTTLNVDANGFLSKVIDPLGNSINLTTSPLGLLTSYKDANGNLYSFQYDTNGFLIKDSDPVGGVINLALTNNSSGYSVAETTAQGQSSNQKIAFSNTASSTTQQYTNIWPNGLQASQTKTQQNGQLTESASLPNGNSYSTTYGPDPRWGMQVPIATTETVTGGNLSMNIASARTASLANPADPFSLISETDTQSVNGRNYKSVFTAASRTWEDTTAAGRVSTTVLDALERISSIQSPGQAPIDYVYDNRGRLSSFSQGTRHSTLNYDDNGLLASITNPLNLTRSFTYDADGRLLTITLDDGRVIQNNYDSNGNMTSTTPPGALPHTVGYSGVDLATSYTPPAVPGGGATTYTFSPDRDPVTMVRPDGEVVNYNYDSTGRLSSLVIPGSTLNFGYDANSGQPLNASVAGGEAISYSYNGPLLTSSSWSGTVAGSVGYAYNNNFWVTSQTVNGGNSVAYTYDNDGLAKKAGSITVNHNAATGFYTGSTLGHAVDTVAYDKVFGEPTAHIAKFGTAILYKANYKRDAIGRLVSLKDTIGGVVTTYTYAYDKTGRLTSVKSGTKTIATYTYDSNSNRLSVTTPSGTVSATYDAQDRLLTYGSASYTYTANGELATKTVGSQLTTYQYDALGNLTGVSLPGGNQISYVVDALNNRVGKKINGVLVAGYLYDGGRLIAQLDSNNQIVSRFVYGRGTTSPDYMVTAAATYRFFADHLGSPRLIVDSVTGQIAERIDYDEFGNVTNDTNPGFQPFGFGGGLYDQDTKLVRFSARDYDPSVGRWTAKDPITFSGGDTNLYGFVLGDPVNRVDPTGLSDKCICPDELWNGGWGFIDRAQNLVMVTVNPAGEVVHAVTGRNTNDYLRSGVSKVTGTPSSVDSQSPEYGMGAAAAEMAQAVAGAVVDGVLLAGKAAEAWSAARSARAASAARKAALAQRAEEARAAKMAKEVAEAEARRHAAVGDVCTGGPRGTVTRGTPGSQNVGSGNGFFQE